MLMDGVRVCVYYDAEMVHHKTNRRSREEAIKRSDLRPEAGCGAQKNLWLTYETVYQWHVGKLEAGVASLSWEQWWMGGWSGLFIIRE